jgi:ESS family glutamate:Na+ symporter
MEFTLNAYYTLISAVIILLIGQYLVKKIRFLQDFNIPEPVAGGLLAAIILFAIHTLTGYQFNFHKDLQTAFMLIFFASIGLSANFAKLKAGGIGLVIFLVIIGGFILVQDLVGVGLAKAMGLDPLIGLIAGSITLVGGHGTAGAWGQVMEQQYGIQGALTLGIACATFGLVIGGLIGGPLARALIARHHLHLPTPQIPNNLPVSANSDVLNFEQPQKERLITATSAVETLALFAACLAFADYMTIIAKGTAFELPTFVWALAGGVIIRNALEYIFRIEMFDRAIDVFGSASLSLFLAMALLSLKLWELAGLAAPLMVILAGQTVVMALYAYFITFFAMGRDYDAAVLAAGHCGFGMGATPTAVANMQAITNKYGPSHKAFLIVPMVGAFFIDLINAGVIQVFIKFFG